MPQSMRDELFALPNKVKDSYLTEPDTEVPGKRYAEKRYIERADRALDRRLGRNGRVAALAQQLR